MTAERPVRARTRDALSDLFRLKVYEGEQAAMSFREGYLAGFEAATTLADFLVNLSPEREGFSTEEVLAELRHELEILHATEGPV